MLYIQYRVCLNISGYITPTVCHCLVSQLIVWLQVGWVSSWLTKSSELLRGVNHINISYTRFLFFQRDFWLRRTRFLISYKDIQRFLRSDLPLELLQPAYEISHFSKGFLASTYDISDFYRDFQWFLKSDLPLVLNSLHDRVCCSFC